MKVNKLVVTAATNGDDLFKLAGMKYGNYKYNAEEWLAKTGVDPRNFGSLIDIRPNGLCGWTKKAEDLYQQHQRGVKLNWNALLGTGVKVK